MFIHEFLFLVANAIERQSELSKVRMPLPKAEKIPLQNHEGIMKYEGMNLEKIYNYDYENRKVPLNPKLLMAQKFNAKTSVIKLDNEKLPVSEELKNLAKRDM